MTEAVLDREAMIRNMAPELAPGRFVFESIADPAAASACMAEAIGMFREAEGISLIRPALENQTPAQRLITLSVNSSLDGVGLTAAVSTTLAAAGIPCNVVAACHHDHIFVPEAQAERALHLLQARARQADPVI